MHDRYRSSHLNLSATGFETDPLLVHWSSDDALLYALALGCGTDELQFCTENSQGVRQRVLPTFAVVIHDVATRSLAQLGDFPAGSLIHGTQRMTFHRELPPRGSAVIRGGISNVFDKGSGALVWIWTRARQVEDDAPLFDLEMGIFIRGVGGWSGDRGPASSSTRPQRPADFVLNYPTHAEQALLYRLTGDRNPLHSDPAVARSSGFDRPILHGLCTLGITGRALLHALCDNDPARMRYMEGRFAAPVWPGDALHISIWKIGATEACFETTAADRLVIDQGRCRFSGSN